MGSNFRNRFESLTSSLKIREKSREDLRIADVYRDALDKNFRDVSKNKEISDWLQRPFELDFSIEKKKIEPTRGEKLNELLADLDMDFDEINRHNVDLNEFESDYERLEFSRRHTNYGTTGKSEIEMRRFINAKMHEVTMSLFL